jgi:glucuronoarabinoxylan endo-1,4-beta-xylanase
MIFQSLTVENVTAFLYWDLIWSEGGLVNLEFPWDKSRWTTSKGYYRTKDFYVFKHFSAFIHPGWTRIGTSSNTEQIKTAAFLSSSNDSATFVVINRSTTDSFKIRLQIPGFIINEAVAYSTDENKNFETSDYLADTVINVAPKSLNTIDLRLVKINTGLVDKTKDSGKTLLDVFNSPNPFSELTRISFDSEENTDYLFEVFDSTGGRVFMQKIGFYPPGKHDFTFNRSGLNSGVYFYRLKTGSGRTGSGRFIISDL